jgi:retron-type reverse transcriptase
MRRVGQLWESVVAFDNLHRAAYQVLRGKRASAAAGDFFCALEDNLLRLREELRAGTYRPGSYRTFWITDPKRRLISAAPLRDRVVHHALINVIEPVFEPRFIHHSYACRRGKGTHRALLRQQLNAGKSRLRQVHEGIEFLGFVVSAARIRLNQTAIRRQRRRLRRLREAYAAGELSWAEVRASLQAWNAHAAHGTTWRLRRAVFGQAYFVQRRTRLATVSGGV